MIEYYAHSPKADIPAQLYTSHIEAVRACATAYAEEVAHFCPDGTVGSMLACVVDTAAIFHDLGKLDAENQAVLSGSKKAKALPVNHVDAGVAYLLSLEKTTVSVLSAILVKSHHKGYPHIQPYEMKNKDFLRDPAIMGSTNRQLPSLVATHRALLPSLQAYQYKGNPINLCPVFLRLALSCLVDADHGDTAHNYGNTLQEKAPPVLQPQKRLAQLDAYIDNLPKSEDMRSTLRSQMYTACRNAQPQANISYCGSPVGSGKTTAIMAHLLQQAVSRGLRRIFVVLPYTNIITQSAEVYRRALVLEGENPAEVVAEVHHRADFESEDARHLSALWRAPIIVTTAVAFFESMASNSTSVLRRLHELPGSAIFVDESHAALPASLLPIAWKWMNIYAANWGCYWLLASGSLCKFWEIEKLTHIGKNPIVENPPAIVPEIVPPKLCNQLQQYEQHRIQYEYIAAPQSLADLTALLAGTPGPHLLILNTVLNAAVVANHLAGEFGRQQVEHLSTALTPVDREATLQRVKQRLNNPTDTNWTLVATSCVEAGVDISFRNGFRELSSMASALQTAGRINRQGNASDAKLFLFSLMKTEQFNENPTLAGAIDALKSQLRNGKGIAPDACTIAISDEIEYNGQGSLHQQLLTAENEMNFPTVEKEFQVIKNNARLAVVSDEIAQKLKYGHINWRELQNNSVQIAKYVLEDKSAPMLLNNIYHWNTGYNNFIGYMAGCLQLKSLEARNMIL